MDSLQTQVGWMEKAVNRALSEVANNSEFLTAQGGNWVCSALAGEPPANGVENEDGEWVAYWAISAPIGSAPLKPF